VVDISGGRNLNPHLESSSCLARRWKRADKLAGNNNTNLTQEKFIMTQRPVFLIAAAVLTITLLVLVVGLYSMTGRISARTTELTKSVTSLQDSLATLQATIGKLNDRAPGLGEYMTTFQLHMGKLWFAGQASNWGLAEYELDELAETMEAGEALHAIKNDVNTASILQAVRATQIPLLRLSLTEKNERKFARAYDQTLETCNSCHRSVGYGFIRITKPLTSPVSNQAWSITN
jgi:hypothetical protein